jgi:hypothetical protein
VALRFTTNLLHLVLAAFLVAACFAFALPVLGWLALGAGCTAVIVSLTGFALTGRGAGQRVLDVLLVLAGAWLIVASRTFAPGHVKWLAFADAALVLSLATIGLAANQRAMLRAVELASASPRAASEDRSAVAELADGAESWRTRDAGFHPHPITAGRTASGQ